MRSSRVHSLALFVLRAGLERLVRDEVMGGAPHVFEAEMQLDDQRPGAT